MQKRAARLNTEQSIGRMDNDIPAPNLCGTYRYVVIHTEILMIMYNIFICISCYQDVYTLVVVSTCR